MAYLKRELKAKPFIMPVEHMEGLKESIRIFCKLTGVTSVKFIQEAIVNEIQYRLDGMDEDKAKTIKKLMPVNQKMWDKPSQL